MESDLNKSKNAGDDIASDDAGGAPVSSPVSVAGAKTVDGTERASDKGAGRQAGRAFMKGGLARDLLLVLLYGLVFFASHTLAFYLRFDFEVSAEYASELAWGWLYYLPLKFGFLALFGQFGHLLSYFSIPDLRRILLATGLSAIALYLIPFLPTEVLPTDDVGVIPRGVILIDFVLSSAGICAVRLGLRVLRERYMAPTARLRGRAQRVAIVGAGDVGAALAKDLLSKRGLGLHPVAFFDDDPSKWRSHIHGVPVVGKPELLEGPNGDMRLSEVIIAMPMAPRKRVGEIVRLLRNARLRVETVPSIDQLATGQVRVSKLREVELQDLLGRDPIELRTGDISDMLRSRVVMVTGAGGSIGSELCRQIASYATERLLLVEQSEVQIFQIEQELTELGFGGSIVPLVADVLDRERMRRIFTRYRPKVVFHAAAHKHVPMMERQPGEAIKNNSFATARLAALAMEAEVERFVLISTDKAINPTNVMGASKRLAEIYVQSLHAANPGKTRFIAVRFGNVLGSSGSVIPTFKKQIEAGGPVRVTHPDVTRYFMTIPEAVGLVLQSATQGTGGEIFVLDMGKPVKIVHLAEQLIELTGLKPGEDIEIEFVGLRPGEKMFEEISHDNEDHVPTTHPKIMRFVGKPVALEEVEIYLESLAREVHELEPSQLKQRLKEAVPEYEPFLG